MLSGEGNAGERRKTTIDLISKRATLHVQHTFFVHFFAVVLHDYNVKLIRFMEGMSYVLSFTFFFTAAHFHLEFAAASISHFLTTAKKFSCCSPNKKMSPLFFYLSLQIAVALFLDELRWPTSYFPFFSVFLFLFLYIPNLWT